MPTLVAPHMPPDRNDESPQLDDTDFELESMSDLIDWDH
jgi:hypothetical protein